MKKALSLVLAGAIVVSTAATAFANTASLTQNVSSVPGAIGTTTTSNVLPYFDANGTRYVVDMPNAPTYTDADATKLYPDSEVRFRLHIFNQTDSTREDLNGTATSGVINNPAAYAALVAAQNSLNTFTSALTAIENAASALPTLDVTGTGRALTQAELTAVVHLQTLLTKTGSATTGYGHYNATAYAALNTALNAAAVASTYFSYTANTSHGLDNTAALAAAINIQDAGATNAVTYALIEAFRTAARDATAFTRTDITAVNTNIIASKLNYAIAAERANVTGGTVPGLSNLGSIPLSVNLKFAKGAAQFSKGKIEKINGVWYAVVEGIDPFIAVDDIDFDFEVYLAQNGTANVSDSWQIVGKYGNRVQLISYSQSNNTQYSNVNTAKVWEGQNDAGNGVFDFGDNVFADFYVTAEKKYYLNMSRKENEEIIKAYPDAALTFFDFMGNYDTFSRIGKVYIPQNLIIKGSSGTNQFQSAEPFIYELIGDELVPVDYKKATIPNKDVPSFMFETKSLGYYVISDIDLAEIDGDFEVDPDVEETPDDNTSKNPSTGSNDFVNIAVVAAVVSLAAAGAVAFKKASK